MSRILINLILITTLCSSANCGNSTKKLSVFRKHYSKEDKIDREAVLRKKAKDALAFCKSHNYNTNFCILIDLGMHSGLKRFFVWDFSKKEISHRFLVSHGCGRMPWSWTWSRDNAKLSNEDGSHCSAAGKYKIGKRGYSNWGIKVNYLLYGLEATNSNAYARKIVLHSWQDVGDDELYPEGTPEGWGCPAISNHALKLLDPKLKKSKKSVLLWIYKS